MRRIKSVGVKELKDNLSAFLRVVKEGEIVLVTERSNVIAEIRQPMALEPQTAADSTAMDWARDGKLALPKRPKDKLPKLHVRLSAGASNRILDQDRGEA